MAVAVVIESDSVSYGTLVGSALKGLVATAADIVKDAWAVIRAMVIVEEVAFLGAMVLATLCVDKTC